MLLAGDASVDSWFREIYVLRAWRVYLATGFDFREKNRICFGSIGVRVRLLSPTLPLYYEGNKEDWKLFPECFAQRMRVTLSRIQLLFRVEPNFVHFYIVVFLLNLVLWSEKR